MMTTQQQQQEDSKASSTLQLVSNKAPNNHISENHGNTSNDNIENVHQSSENDIISSSSLSTKSSPSSSSLSQQQQQQQRRTTGTGNKRHGARNQHRHKSFVKWIIETFPKQIELSSSPCNEYGNGKDDKSNNEGEEDQESKNDIHQNRSRRGKRRRYHILDVAGGKGEVSARLTMCCQQNVIMVDPRQADIVECFQSLVLPKIPNKWQKRIISQIENDPEFLSNTINTRFQQLVTTFDSSNLLLVQDIDESNSHNNGQHQQQNQQQQKSLLLHDAIINSSLILGLHADSATEAIVDIALKYKKPFVVVPCCVFPNFFTQRQIVDVNNKVIKVRTHDQFCTYLLNKSPKLTKSILPFEGRNIAIWWDGK